MTESVWDALSAATERLEPISESPQFDAELLLRHVAGYSRAQLFARYDALLDPAQLVLFERLVERRLSGESIAYIRGSKGFRTIDLAVDHRVLVPRPETERFVDYALRCLERLSGSRRVIDVGTGSGAIAFALATELADRRPDVQVIGSERYRPALEVAAMNRARLGLTDRVELVQADLLDGLPGPFDIILANLPYLRDDQRHPSIEVEPDTSLYAGPDGFAYYRRILPQLPKRLTGDGLFVGEIDPDQAEFAVIEVRAALNVPVWIERDDAGDERYLLAGAI